MKQFMLTVAGAALLAAGYVEVLGIVARVISS
jgi:hypothetical protein